MEILSKLNEGLQLFIGVLTALIALAGWTVAVLAPIRKKNKAIDKVAKAIESGMHPADAVLHAAVSASDCVKSKRLPTLTELSHFKK